MKTSIVEDEVGRLELPKEIREAFGIFGRMSLQVEVVDNPARLSAPEETSGAIKRQGKRMVYGGTLPENWESSEAILKMRESRFRRKLLASPNLLGRSL